MYSSYERSVNAKKQLRDKYGKWIFMGGRAKWFDSVANLFRSGKVVGISPTHVSIHDKSDGKTYKVPRGSVEAVTAKATLGEKPAANNPSEVKVEASQGGNYLLRTSKAQEGATAVDASQLKPGDRVYGSVDGNGTPRRPEPGNSAKASIHAAEDTYSDGQVWTYVDNEQGMPVWRSDAGVTQTGTNKSGRYIRESDAVDDQVATLNDFAQSDAQDDSAPTDISTWTKVKALGGSTGAALYKDDEGNEYVVKFPQEEKAKNEILSNRLYGAMGIPTPDTELVVQNGKLGVASPFMPNKGELWQHINDPEVRKEISKGYVPDSFMANWDFAGLDNDNIVVLEDGTPIRVDNGGALIYRAQGAPKGAAFADTVGELDTLRKSDQGKQFYANLTPEEVAQSAAPVVNLTDQQIDDLVDSVDFKPETADYVKAKLKARRDDIKAKIPEALNVQAPQETAPEPQSAPETVDAPEAPLDGTQAAQATLDSLKDVLAKIDSGEQQENAPVDVDKAPAGAVLTSSPNNFTSFYWVKNEDGTLQLYNKYGNTVGTPKTSSQLVGKFFQSGQIVQGGPEPEAEASLPETPEPAVSKFQILDDPGLNGDGYHASGPWGKYGAAGVMIEANDADGSPMYLLVQRGPGVSSNVGKWQLPGGAMNSKEDPYQGTARETNEELQISQDQLNSLSPVGEVVFDNGKGWQYTNITARAPEAWQTTVDGTETGDARWFYPGEIQILKDNGQLHPSFADKYDEIVATFQGDTADKAVIKDPDVDAPDETDNTEPTKTDSAQTFLDAKSPNTPADAAHVIQEALLTYPKDQPANRAFALPDGSVVHLIKDPAEGNTVWLLDEDDEILNEWNDRQLLEDSWPDEVEKMAFGGEPGAPEAESAPEAPPVAPSTDTQVPTTYDPGTEITDFGSEYLDNAPSGTVIHETEPGVQDWYYRKNPDGDWSSYSTTLDMVANHSLHSGVIAQTDATNIKQVLVSSDEWPENKSDVDEPQPGAPSSDSTYMEPQELYNTSLEEFQDMEDGTVVRVQDEDGVYLYKKRPDGDWDFWADSTGHSASIRWSDELAGVNWYKTDVAVVDPSEWPEPEQKRAPEVAEDNAEAPVEGATQQDLIHAAPGSTTNINGNTFTKNESDLWFNESTDVGFFSPQLYTASQIFQQPITITPPKTRVPDTEPVEGEDAPDLHAPETGEPETPSGPSDVGDPWAEALAPEAETETTSVKVWGGPEKFAELPVGTQVSMFNDNLSYWEKTGDNQWTHGTALHGLSKYQVIDDAKMAEDTDEDFSYTIVKTGDSTSAPTTPDNEPLADWEKELLYPALPDSVDPNTGIGTTKDGRKFILMPDGETPVYIGTVIKGGKNEVGKVEAFPKGGKSVKVTTPDGHTKFWQTNKSSIGDAKDFVPTESKFGIQTDENGKEYVNDANGNAVYVGDTVTSSGKTGFTGEVTGLKAGGEFILVKDPADGKVKPRRVNKITKDQASTPAPEPATPELNYTYEMGDSIPDTLEAFSSLPPGTMITVDSSAMAPDDVKAYYTKWDDGLWHNDTSSNVFGDEAFVGGEPMVIADTDASYPNDEGVFNDPDEGTLDVPSPTGYNTGDQIEVDNPDVWDQFPIGTKVSSTTSGSVFTKDEYGDWVGEGGTQGWTSADMSDPGEPMVFQELGEGKASVEPGPVPETNNSGLSLNDTVPFDKDSWDSLPVGTQVVSQSGAIYIKQQDGKWKNPSMTDPTPWSSFDMADPSDPMIITYLPGDDVEAPSNSLIGESPSSPAELDAAPAGTVLTHPAYPKFVYTKQPNGTWIAQDDTENHEQYSEGFFGNDGTSNFKYTTIPGETTAPQFVIGQKPTNSEELDAAPVGTVLDIPGLDASNYTKQADGTWTRGPGHANIPSSQFFYQNLDGPTTNFVYAPAEPEQEAVAEASTPTPNVTSSYAVGDIIDDMGKFTQLPVGSVVRIKSGTTGGYQKVGPNEWKKIDVPFSNTYPDSDFDPEGMGAGTWKVAELPDGTTPTPVNAPSGPTATAKNGKTISIGDTVSHPVKNTSGTVIGITPGPTSKTGGDSSMVKIQLADGTKTQYQARFLNQDSSATPSVSVGDPVSASEIAKAPVGTKIVGGINSNATFVKTTPNNWTYATFDFSNAEVEKAVTKAQNSDTDTDPYVYSEVPGSLPKSAPTQTTGNQLSSQDVAMLPVGSQVQGKISGAVFTKDSESQWSDHAGATYHSGEINQLAKNGNLTLLSTPSATGVPGKNTGDKVDGPEILSAPIGTQIHSAYGSTYTKQDAYTWTNQVGDSLINSDLIIAANNGTLTYLDRPKGEPQTGVGKKSGNTSLPDPSSPWYQQPEPVEPTAPTLDPLNVVTPSFFDEMNEMYKAQKGGKDIKSSSYWSKISPLFDTGDDSWPAGTSTKPGFEQKDRFDFLLSRGWITPEMAEQGRAQVAANKAKNKIINDKNAATQAVYDAEMAKFKSDYHDWKHANGLGSSFDAGSYVAMGLNDPDIEIFTSNEQGKDWANENLPVDASKISDLGKQKISAYTGSWYQTVNSELRTAKMKKQGVSGLGPSMQKAVQAMDEAFEVQEPVEKPFQVHRGTNVGTLLGPNGTYLKDYADAQSMVGSVVSDPGYMSSSVGTAPGYGKGGSAYLHITVPAGANVLWLNAKGSNHLGGLSGEREVLLPRGSKLLVHKVEKGSGPGSTEVKIHIYMEMVPEDWTPEIGEANKKKFAGVVSQMTEAEKVEGGYTVPGSPQFPPPDPDTALAPGPVI